MHCIRAVVILINCLSNCNKLVFENNCLGQQTVKCSYTLEMVDNFFLWTHIMQFIYCFLSVPVPDVGHVLFFKRKSLIKSILILVYVRSGCMYVNFYSNYLMYPYFCILGSGHVFIKFYTFVFHLIISYMNHVDTYVFNYCIFNLSYPLIRHSYIIYMLICYSCLK